MLQLEDKIVSFDVFDKHFLCQLQTCKGACCVEGDAGAPLTGDEVKKLEEVLPKVEPYLTPEGKQAIAQGGVSYKDRDGDDVTQLVDNSICAFAYKDEKGCVLCALERAFREGKTTFRKPISCYLYPVRLTKYPTFTAVNIHEWKICQCAFKAGDEAGLPIYKFLKEPLIEVFGEAWYKELEIAAQEYYNWKKSRKR